MPFSHLPLENREFGTVFTLLDDAPLFYWHREARNSNAEVDYVVQFRNQILPIEVKICLTFRLHKLLPKISLTPPKKFDIPLALRTEKCNNILALLLLVRDASVMGFMSGGMVADTASEGFCNYLA